MGQPIDPCICSKECGDALFNGGNGTIEERRIRAGIERWKEESPLRTPQFWLAKIDQHGNPTLHDGSHSDRVGVEKAAYLLGRLGFSKGERFACAEVILTEVEAKSHGANEEALRTLNNIGLRP